MITPPAAAAWAGVSAAGLGYSTQAVISDPASSFLQYGALGVFAFLSAIAVGVLFKHHNETLARERARADKLSEELSELRDKIQDRYLVTLEQASSAIREALAATRTVR